jgi:hypothetical protein
MKNMLLSMMTLALIFLLNVVGCEHEEGALEEAGEEMEEAAEEAGDKVEDATE